MAHKSKDGKEFTNRSAMKRHETRMSTVAPGAKANEEPGDEKELEVRHVVGKHGPAHEIVVRHADKHTVDSQHEDGYEHHSEHPTADEAHETAATLGGAHLGMGEEMNSPDASSGIPGLSA